MSRDRIAGVTLDAGALMAFERGDRRTIALLARAAETAAGITVPATVCHWKESRRVQVVAG